MNRNSPRIVQRPMMWMKKYQLFLIDSVRIRDSKFRLGTTNCALSAPLPLVQINQTQLGSGALSDNSMKFIFKNLTIVPQDLLLCRTVFYHSCVMIIGTSPLNHLGFVPKVWIANAGFDWRPIKGGGLDDLTGSGDLGEGAGDSLPLKIRGRLLKIKGKMEARKRMKKRFLKNLF